MTVVFLGLRGSCYVIAIFWKCFIGALNLSCGYQMLSFCDTVYKQQSHWWCSQGLLSSKCPNWPWATDPLQDLLLNNSTWALLFLCSLTLLPSLFLTQKSEGTNKCFLDGQGSELCAVRAHQNRTRGQTPKRISCSWFETIISQFALNCCEKRIKSNLSLVDLYIPNDWITE